MLSGEVGVSTVDHISTFEELGDFLTKLHDCPFDFERTSFDKVSEIWSGIFLRPLWEDARAEHRGLPLLYFRTRLPVAEVTLTVARVLSVEVIEDQGIGLYTFNEIERAPSGLRLLFNQAMQINLQLSGPIEATYEEQPLHDRWAVYRQFMLVQSGPEIEKA